MKSIILAITTIFLFSACATWEGVKSDSSKAWDATKDTTSKAYKSTKKAVHDATAD